MQFETKAVERLVELPDGSRLFLASESRASALFDQGSRQVELHSGTAKFEVASGLIPFIVEAGEIDVEVLGTVFSVDKTADRTEVVLHEGSIALKRKSRVVARLKAGETARYTTEGSNLARISFRPLVVSAGADSARPDGSEGVERQVELVVVEQERLDRLAAYLEAHGDLEMQLANAAIGAFRVSGEIDATSPQKDLARLIAQYDLELEQQAEGSLLITRSSRSSRP